MTMAPTIPVAVVLPRTISAIVIPMGLTHRVVAIRAALGGCVITVPHLVHHVLLAAVLQGISLHPLVVL